MEAERLGIEKPCNHRLYPHSHDDFPRCVFCRQMITPEADQRLLRFVRRELEKGQPLYAIAYDMSMACDGLELNLERLGYVVETRPVLRKRK